MARKQDSAEVAMEKALASADYETERRQALKQLAKLRGERLQREANMADLATSKKRPAKAARS